VKLTLQVVKSYILTADKISLENMRDEDEILSTNWSTVRMLTLYEIRFFYFDRYYYPCTFFYIFTRGIAKFNRYAKLSTAFLSFSANLIAQHRESTVHN